MTKTVQDKVEEWLKNAPKEIQITEIDLDETSEKLQTTGKRTPTIIKGGYIGQIYFRCTSWDKL